MVVNVYAETIEQIVALAVLMPIVAALGGNVGNQAVTVTVRKIALGQVDWHNAYPVILREIKMSSINGLIIRWRSFNHYVHMVSPGAIGLSNCYRYHH